MSETPSTSPATSVPVKWHKREVDFVALFRGLMTRVQSLFARKPKEPFRWPDPKPYHGNPDYSRVVPTGVPFLPPIPTGLPPRPSPGHVWMPPHGWVASGDQGGYVGVSGACYNWTYQKRADLCVQVTGQPPHLS